MPRHEIHSMKIKEIKIALDHYLNPLQKEKYREWFLLKKADLVKLIFENNIQDEIVKINKKLKLTPKYSVKQFPLKVLKKIIIKILTPDITEDFENWAVITKPQLIKLIIKHNLENKIFEKMTAKQAAKYNVSKKDLFKTLPIEESKKDEVEEGEYKAPVIKTEPKPEIKYEKYINAVDVAFNFLKLSFNNTMELYDKILKQDKLTKQDEKDLQPDASTYKYHFGQYIDRLHAFQKVLHIGIYKPRDLDYNHVNIEKTKKNQQFFEDITGKYFTPVNKMNDEFSKKYHEILKVFNGEEIKTLGPYTFGTVKFKGKKPEPKPEPIKKIEIELKPEDIKQKLMMLVMDTPTNILVKSLIKLGFKGKLENNPMKKVLQILQNFKTMHSMQKLIDELELNR